MFFTSENLERWQFGKQISLVKHQVIDRLNEGYIFSPFQLDRARENAINKKSSPNDQY